MNEKKARQIGVRRYLSKPIQGNDLIRNIREVLDEQKSGRLKTVPQANVNHQARSIRYDHPGTCPGDRRAGPGQFGIPGPAIPDI